MRTKKSRKCVFYPRMYVLVRDNDVFVVIEENSTQAIQQAGESMPTRDAKDVRVRTRKR